MADTECRRIRVRPTISMFRCLSFPHRGQRTIPTTNSFVPCMHWQEAYGRSKGAESIRGAAVPRSVVDAVGAAAISAFVDDFVDFWIGSGVVLADACPACHPTVLLQMVGFDKRRYRPGRRIVVPNIANTGACRPIHADKHEDKTEDFEETEIPFRFLRSKKSHNTVVEITDPLRPIVGIDFFRYRNRWREWR